MVSDTPLPVPVKRSCVKSQPPPKTPAARPLKKARPVPAAPPPGGTYTHDEIRVAFWEVFHGSGKWSFHKPGDPDSDRATQIAFEFLTECLQHRKTVRRISGASH